MAWWLDGDASRSACYWTISFMRKEDCYASRTTSSSELQKPVFSSWHSRHPVRLAGDHPTRAGVPVWWLCPRRRDCGCGACLTLHQRAGVGTVAGRGDPGHSGRHRRLCLASHYRLRPALPDCGLGDCDRHHADRRCLYPPTGDWAQMAAGVLRVDLGHLWHIDRPLAWSRAAHRDLVDRYLRDCVWSHVPCGVLPVTFSDCSPDLMVNK